MSNTESKHVVFVRTKSHDYDSQLSNDLNINISTALSMQELYPLLSDTTFNPTCIAIDIDEVSELDIDLFDIIYLLSTLIKCTTYQDCGVSTKRQTSVAALVSESTPIEIIKNIMLTPGIDHVGLKVGGSITYSDVKDDMALLLDGIFTPSKILTKLLHPKQTKCNTNSNSIKLTPRQSQILNLVTTRGISNKIIARMLHISESTVKLHLSAIFKKYGVKNRTQLVLSTIEHS